MEEPNREQELDSGAAIAEAERLTLESAMTDHAGRRKQAIALNTRCRISDSELDELLEEIGQEQEGVKRRLIELQAASGEVHEPLDPDLLEELRLRLDIGLNETQRQEIGRLLVNQITVHTDVAAEVTNVRVLIEYRFSGVVNTFMGIREELNYNVSRTIELASGRGSRG